MRRCVIPVSWCSLLLVLLRPLSSQTSYGLVTGVVRDAITQESVDSATVRYTNLATGQEGFTQARDGLFTIPSLSPGSYTLVAVAAGYQDRIIEQLDLPVAGHFDVRFELWKLSDPWHTGAYRSVELPRSHAVASYYGPDINTSRSDTFEPVHVDTSRLEAAVSTVIDSRDIEDLPLLGRDVYAMLLLLPGVTSDTATERGLGYSANGQRASSSNYLLDGVENNNQLVTGPLSVAAPEFVEEYRISTSNYSAEYGRTSGFVANAITRSGTNAWHGMAFTYLKNQELDANGFQENANGIARAHLTDWEPGFLMSGPVIRNRLFLFGGFETERFHSQTDPQEFALPTASFVGSTDPGSFAGQYLRKYVPQSQPSGPGDSALATISPPADFNRLHGLLRADYSSPSGVNRLFGRLGFDSLNEPDLFFSPYRQFSTPYQQQSLTLALGVTFQASASVLNEFRMSRSGDAARFETPQPGIPQLVEDQMISLGDVAYRLLLPGGIPEFNYRNLGHDWEVLDNSTWITGRHIAKIGGGFLQRDIGLTTAAYPDGQLQYATLRDFAQDQPENLTAEVDSQTQGTVSPDRSYRYRQLYAFVQDSFHATSRIVLNYGVRYDYFGAPVNVGQQKDLLFEFGPGSDIETRLANKLQYLPAAGNQAIFSSRPSNWAARMGMAWDLSGNGGTLFRASFGTFYDPLFDNLWENVIQNRYHTKVWSYSAPVVVSSTLSALQAAGTYQPSSNLLNYLLFEPSLRAPRTDSAFAGIQQTITSGVTLEVDVLGSRGRGLITTDILNRSSSSDQNLEYRANQGSSDYSGLVAAFRFRRPWLTGQVSYSWSRSIDNQSEALAGTFFDENVLHTAPPPYVSSFTTEFDSSADRANSDFDQRQNLVFFGVWQLPTRPGGRKLARVFHNWTLSTLGAIRSGLPFTVYAPETNGPFGPIFDNERADLVAPSHPNVFWPHRGGQILLNPAAFADPQINAVGTSGRNAFTGPGLINTDASIARTFHPRTSQESLSLTLRADFYNLLNHANLNNPESFYGNSLFGVALYGRTETNSAFPLAEPLTETARQIQLMLQLRF